MVGDRLVKSAIVLREIMGMPEKGIPKDLLDKCACVAVIPGMIKGGFFIGANYGKGAISCRTKSGEGPWSPPSMLLLTGGSFGLQIGAQAVDLVFVIMNLSGLESLLDSQLPWEEMLPLQPARWAAPRPLKPTPDVGQDSGLLPKPGIVCRPGG